MKFSVNSISFSLILTTGNSSYWHRGSRQTDAATWAYESRQTSVEMKLENDKTQIEEDSNNSIKI